MKVIKFPKDQLHRIKYTKLTKEQIDRKLVPVADGPECESEYSDSLVGKSIKIVTDNGPVLNYNFKSKGKLTLKEGNASAIKAGYGALTYKNIVLFSHMEPGTQKGFNVIIDLDTNLATVFEVWFSGYKVLREVQRQMYYGYVEVPGKESPKARHHLTNRIEGKGFYWKQDTGIETLEFYPSIMSSSFVELTRLGGELTFCGPSDYIMISDDLFIFDRVECEMSGIFTLYVLDVQDVEQVGVRLGFNEEDELEYYMFRGAGEIVGQIAHFESLADRGEKISFGANMPPMTEKGQRIVYRPLSMYPPMTEEEVHAAVQKKTAVFVEDGLMGGDQKMQPTDYLAGKKITVRCDGKGPVMNYRFDGMKLLHWQREGESQWHEEKYEAFEPADNLIYFCHPLSNTRPVECKKIVVDFSTALATCVSSKLGSEYMANEVSYKIDFGVLETEGMIPPRYYRHAFTDELVGGALTWNYSDALSSMHVYSTPHSYSWTIFMENGAFGMQWSSHADYVKLRDDIYLFTWVEEACNGTQGTIIINNRTMHDCGFAFHVDKDGLNLSTIGAYSRNAGSYDIKKYFPLKLR